MADSSYLEFPVWVAFFTVYLEADSVTLRLVFHLTYDTCHLSPKLSCDPRSNMLLSAFHPNIICTIQCIMRGHYYSISIRLLPRQSREIRQKKHCIDETLHL